MISGAWLLQLEWVKRCSTPGGIETVISRGRNVYGDGARWCSTPGGIETVIRACSPLDSRRGDPVLNARRHRDGDQSCAASR